MHTAILNSLDKKQYFVAYIKSFCLHLGILAVVLVHMKLNTSKPIIMPKQAFIEVVLMEKPQEKRAEVAKPTSKPKPPKKPKKPSPKSKPKPAKVEKKVKPAPVKPKQAPKPKVSKPKPKAVKPKPKVVKPKPKVVPPVFDPTMLEDAIQKETLERALEAENAEKLAAEQAKEEQRQASEIYKYKRLIKSRIEQFFTLPPSAKSGMSVLLEIHLFPDGQVREVKLLKSSGDINLDRFALRAVQDAGYFDVPNEVQLFQRYFRQFNFNFKPEL